MYRKWLAVFISLVLLLLLVPACGKEKGETLTPTATPIVTATPGPTTTIEPTTTVTATPTATPSPTSAGPIKIGGINAWSGPGAMAGFLSDPIAKVVEWQVKQAGGILGGREVKVVKYDDRGVVADAAAGAKKLILEDKVSALVWGGLSGAEMDAISDVAEASNVLYVTMGEFANTEAKVTLSATFRDPAYAKPIADLATRVLKAKTVGFLANELSDNHRRVGYYKESLEPAGLKTVYEEYVPVGTQDLMSYLTKIKYANPDVLVLDTGQNEFLMTAARQILELGGWGNTKVITLPSGESAIKLAGAADWYVMSAWIPSVPNAESQKFVQDYRTVNGGPLMNSAQIFYYNAVLIAVKAVEFAGSDDQAKVAAAVRSGKLEVDTPMGYARFTLENKGYGGLFPVLTHVEGGKLVPVTIPQ